MIGASSRAKRKRELTELTSSATQSPPRKRKKFAVKCPDCHTSLHKVEHHVELRIISPRIYKNGYMCDMCNNYSPTWPMWHCPGRNKLSGDLCFWDCCLDCLEDQIHEESLKSIGNDSASLLSADAPPPLERDDVLFEPPYNPTWDEPTKRDKIPKKKKRKRVRNTKKKYIGTTYMKERQRWRGSVTLANRTYHCGFHENEVDCAWAVNLKCDQLAIRRKNPQLKSPPLTFAHSPGDYINSFCPNSAEQEKICIYKGVTWNSLAEMWDAELLQDTKRTYVGVFRTTKAAAEAINRMCEEYGIPLQNPNLNKKKTSKYHGVSFNEETQKWKAQVTNGCISYHIGLFKSELNAAHAVNMKCRQMGMSIKNRDIGPSPADFLPDKYEGVSWHEPYKKWIAVVETNDDKVFAGFHDTSTEAAIAVNMKCDELGVPRKNSSIGDATPAAKTSKKRPYKKRKKPTQKPIKGQSKYNGVSWSLQLNKWVGKVIKDDETFYAGCYKDELDAAHAVNIKADDIHISWLNQNIGIPPSRLKVEVKQQTMNKHRHLVLAKYKHGSSAEMNGLHYDGENRTWIASFSHKGEEHYIGRYADMTQAANAVNKKCDQLGIARKNTTQDSAHVQALESSRPKVCYKSGTKWMALEISQPRMQPGYKSPYDGVTWNSINRKWLAQLVHNGEVHYAGNYETEINAGHAVNVKCDELKIPHRNSFIHQSPPIEKQTETELTDVPVPPSLERSQADSWKWLEGMLQIQGVPMEVFQHTDIQRKDQLLKFGISKWEYLVGLTAIISDLKSSCGIDINSPNTPYVQSRKAYQQKIKSLREFGQGDDELLSRNVRPQSKYKGVYANCKSGSWYGRVTVKTKNHHCGTYGTELAAAHAVNRKCDELGLPRKNPSILTPEPTKDSPPADFCWNASKSSKYDGVRWDNYASGWRASIRHEGREIVVGRYSSEFTAACAINRKCAELGIPSKIAKAVPEALNIPQIDMGPSLEINQIPRTSMFDGVQWDEETQQWCAIFDHNGKTYHAGYHGTQLEAAKAVNIKCDQLLIPRKNIDEFDHYPNFKETKSKYVCVSWSKRRQKWQARITKCGTLYHGGYYEFEMDAAHAVNVICDRIGEPRKHIGLEDPPYDIKQRVEQRIVHSHDGSIRSQFRNVSWAPQFKQWQASVSKFVDGSWVSYHGGYFTKENRAAHAVNLLCDRLGMPRENPRLGDPPPDINLPEINPRNSCAIKKSEFQYVFWDSISQTWMVLVHYDNQDHYVGSYTDEFAAAHAANQFCAEEGIPQKNFGIGKPPVHLSGNFRKSDDTTPIDLTQDGPNDAMSFGFDPRSRTYVGRKAPPAPNPAEPRRIPRPKKRKKRKPKKRRTPKPTEVVTIDDNDEAIDYVKPASKPAVLSRTSTFNGVSWNDDKQKWQCQVYDRPTGNVSVGYFDSELECARAYDSTLLRILGDEALPAQFNFPLHLMKMPELEIDTSTSQQTAKDTEASKESSGANDDIAKEPLMPPKYDVSVAKSNDVKIDSVNVKKEEIMDLDIQSEDLKIAEELKKPELESNMEVENMQNSSMEWNDNFDGSSVRSFQSLDSTPINEGKIADDAVSWKIPSVLQNLDHDSDSEMSSDEDSSDADERTSQMSFAEL